MLLAVQVELSVDVHRVGTHETKESPVMPRSSSAEQTMVLGPIVSHDEHITSISQWAVQEFVHFFQREREVSCKPALLWDLQQSSQKLLPICT